MQYSLHKVLVIPAVACALVVGLIAPVSAQEADAPVRDRDGQTTVVRPEVRPADGRPDVRRPHVEVIALGCEGVRDDSGNLGSVCRWSSVEKARGYQLWRIVDRGDRELAGTYGSDTNIARDDVPDDARLVRYAVLALDAEGDIIGRSRVVRVQFRQTDTPDIDREVDVRRVDHDVLRRWARYLAV